MTILGSSGSSIYFESMYLILELNNYIIENGLKIPLAASYFLEDGIKIYTDYFECYTLSDDDYNFNIDIIESGCLYDLLLIQNARS